MTKEIKISLLAQQRTQLIAYDQLLNENKDKYFQEYNIQLKFCVYFTDPAMELAEQPGG